ncbi:MULTISPECIES: hypothetical protein [Planktothricoides]|uniref:Uncharacterized protein n=2 Tax=Planktothricoides raciborskii TaxID=132608 RepID=A0AAU8JE66_9CYAN|nr:MULTISPECIES: hypothetical protein [Planktothricoides]MBD2545934.1 hypothetical protein [Planktothricoides raciborskii FACHB-1370]MBD2584051.1 hypothetical protein [Planktothricoides raciborskii FACHB-1261]
MAETYDCNIHAYFPEVIPLEISTTNFLNHQSSTDNLKARLNRSDTERYHTLKRIYFITFSLITLSEARKIKLKVHYQIMLISLNYLQIKLKFSVNTQESIHHENWGIKNYKILVNLIILNSWQLP